MQLQDQNTLLKAQLSTGSVAGVPHLNEAQNSEVKFLNEKLKTLEGLHLEQNLELERLRKDQEDLLELLTDQDVRLNHFKSRLRELGENIEEEEDSDNNSIDIS